MVDNRLAALPRPTLQETEFTRQRGFIEQLDPALSEERMCFEICLRLRAFGVLVVDALSLKGFSNPPSSVPVTDDGVEPEGPQARRGCTSGL